MPTDSIDLTLTINGVRQVRQVDTRLLLVEALRECFGVLGPKIGCATGDCGACTISVNGQITKSCLRLAVSAQQAEIATIEGLAEDDHLSSLQEAFWNEHGFQCGFCLSGMLFAAQDLLADNPRPSDDEIRHAISGNLCRCTGYQNIVAAIRSAAGATDVRNAIRSAAGTAGPAASDA